MADTKQDAKVDSKYQLLPPEGDPDVGKRVFQILGIIVADKVRLGLHERWFRNYQLRRGKHWKTESPAGVPLVSANFAFTHIQRTTNMLTDNNPTFNVVVSGELDPAAKDAMIDLQRTTEHWWGEQEQQDVLETSILNGEQYGPAIEKVIFNPDLEFNLGEVEAIPIDPFRFGWYPVRLEQARNLQKCEAVCHFYPISIRQLRAKHPKMADKIKPDKELLKELYDVERREIAGAETQKGISLISVAGAIKSLVNFFSGAETALEDDEETLVCEMWVRDKSTITDKNGTRPKYTGEIRCVTVCSGGVVLEDKDNPSINPNLDPEEAQKTYLFDKFPFSMANSVKDTSNAWGMSDLEQIEWLMMEINKSLSQMVLDKDRKARQKLINPRNSGVPNEELTNYPGIINPSDAQTGAGIRWLEAPATSIDFEKTVEMFKNLMFLIAGTFDLDQAQVQGREVIAYKAIAALLERAATMSRGKIRSYSRLIRDRGRMFLSHVMNFYTEERWITYTDQDGQDATKPIKGSDLVMPMRLEVVTGSTMPRSQVQQREEAIVLGEKGFIDQPEVLEKLDWSNRSEVIKRMQAGPVGATLEKLQGVQFPPELLAYIKTVAEADPKELKKAVEKGEFPGFGQIIQKMLNGGQEQVDPAQQAEFEARQAEVRKTLAMAEKSIAERDLLVEKMLTERIDQQVKSAGIEFDKETLAMQRAELVSKIEGEAKADYERGVDMAVKMHGTAEKNRPGYNEKGMKSNNKES